MMMKELELHMNIMAQVMEKYPLKPNAPQEEQDKINEDRSALYDTLYDQHTK